MNKSVLFVHPEGNWKNNPTLDSTLRLLANSGIQITYISDFRYEKNSMLPQGMQIKTTSRLVRSLCRFSLIKLASQPLSRLLAFLYVLLYVRKKYSAIIGVDREGLIIAHNVSKLIGAKYAFFSFEIFFLAETGYTFKELEKKASRDIWFWVTQDEIRQEKLVEENGLDPESSMIIPVSSTPFMQNGQSNKQHLALNLPEDKKYCIVIGSIDKWTMIDEILLSVESWPPEWALLIHSRYEIKDDLKKNIRQEMIGEKIFFTNLTKLNYEEMHDLLSKAQFGLAFYNPDYSNRFLGNNIKYLGRSSGKIATYLRSGLPVITSKIGLMANDIETYQLGKVLGSPAEIGGFLLEASSKKAYQHQCLEYFNTHLNFELYGEKLLRRFEED
jgi:glycosyltransferase involved in cell wall biosynthesis